MKKILALLFSGLLAACNLNTDYRSMPQAWVDAPLDGMVLPLAPYEIVAHANDESGIAAIEIGVNGAVLAFIPGAAPFFIGRQVWNPTAPGEYVIRARAISAGGVWSDFAEATVTILAPHEPPGATPQAAPGPTSTASVPSLTLTRNANCRRGPSQVFEAVDAIVAGNTVPLEGKNEDESWWLVKLPSGEKCWMSAITGNTFGDIANVPVEQGPPAPQPETLGCYVYDPNLQPVCTDPCPPNANPGGECTP